MDNGKETERSTNKSAFTPFGIAGDKPVPEVATPTKTHKEFGWIMGFEFA